MPCYRCVRMIIVINFPVIMDMDNHTELCDSIRCPGMCRNSDRHCEEGDKRDKD